MRGKIKYPLIIAVAVVVFSTWDMSSVIYSFWRVSSILENNDALFNETDTLIQSLSDAETPLETCEILSKVYGYTSRIACLIIYT